jgi:hypothetical protein
MSDTEINTLTGDIRVLLNSAKVLDAELSEYSTAQEWLDKQKSLEQTIKDTNDSILRRQRSEIDTKSRIMTYAEDDMKRNFKLLNSQYIILISLICIVVFVLLWGFFELIMDSDGGQRVVQNVRQQFGGSLKRFFSMSK